MKKTVLLTALIAAFALTACEDKQAVQQATQRRRRRDCPNRGSCSRNQSSLVK